MSSLGNKPLTYWLLAFVCVYLYLYLYYNYYIGMSLFIYIYIYYTYSLHSVIRAYVVYSYSGYPREEVRGV